MDLKKELLILEEKIRCHEKQEKEHALLLHTKSHMFHNKKMHLTAVQLLKKYGMNHPYFDALDD